MGVTEALERAARANAAGRPAEAERVLRRLLSELVDSDPATAVLTGRAYVTLALARHDQGYPREAAALLRRAERIDDPSRVVATLAGIQRAGLAGRAGRWRDVLAALDRVRADAAAVGPRAEGVLALNSGLACQFLGRFAESERLSRQAVRVARAAGLDDIVAAATHNLGRLAFCRGDVVEALERMAEAERISPDVRTSGIGLDRARVLLDAGLLDVAERVLDEVTATATADGLLGDLAEADLERARLRLLQGRHGEARAAAGNAAAAFGSRRATAWRRQADLLALRAELALLTNSPARSAQLRALGGRAQRLARELPAGSDAAEAGLLAAEAAARAGALAVARRRLVAARALRDPTLPVRLHDRLTATLIEVAAGRSDRARAELRAGLGALAREQGRHAGLTTRTSVALHGRSLVRLDLSLALRSGRADRVLMAAERWRGVSHRLPRVTPLADPELAELVGRTRQARLALNDADLAPAVAARLRDDLVRWERAVERREWLVRGVGTRGPADDRRATGLPAPYAALRSAVLAADTRLVALFGHEGRLGAAVLDRGGCRVVDLAPLPYVTELCRRIAADLRAATVAPARLRPVVERTLEATMARLGTTLGPALGGGGTGPGQLGGPAAARAAGPSAGRLVILPTTPFAALPWRMLPGLADVPVTVSPSATYWLPAGTPRIARPHAVALAGPGLPRAGAEARAVARAWPDGHARTGRSADRTRLLSALRAADVVHLAAHGTHVDDSPLFSTIRMADGPVFAHELHRAAGERIAAHVVLSACDVGRAESGAGEETLGLTAALQACGVRSVVAAVAPVPDDVAAALMGRYHRALARGADPAAALAATATSGAERLFCAYGSAW